jgi:hypothetical protein
MLFDATLNYSGKDFEAIAEEMLPEPVNEILFFDTGSKGEVIKI